MKFLTATFAAALSLAATAPAFAQANSGLPDSPTLRAVACAATVQVMASSIRTGDAKGAAELDAVAAKWRAQAHATFAASNQAAKAADDLIAAKVASMTEKAGLPGGTFTRAQICQNEAVALPGA